MSMTPEQFLSGSSVPAAKFDTIGVRIGGTIVNDPEVRQQTDFQTRKPIYWPSGDPKMQLIIDFQSGQHDPDIDDDDGVRRFYIKGKNLTNAVRDGISAAGAKGVERGGQIYITYTSDGTPAAKGISAPKEYVVDYVKPTATSSAGFLGTDQPQQAPQPTQAVPAAAQAPVGVVGGYTAEQLASAGLTPEAAAALLNVNPAALHSMVAQAIAKAS